jgi:hypothetical protein
MLKIYSAIVILLFAATVSNAQSVVKGTVYESGTNTRLNNVFVRDNNNRQVTITDKNGNFSIRAAVGHTLIFNSPGYVSDTLYVIDLRPKKVEMVTQTINLRQVTVNATRTNFDPRAEYPEVYEKSKVYAFSPSTWFSKEGKDARRLKRYFKHEAEERHVDAVFTPAYVGSIVPLKGNDLVNFISLYRPTYAFLRNNEGPSLVAYINDSYKKFLALPPEQRKLQSLTGQ